MDNTIYLTLDHGAGSIDVQHPALGALIAIEELIPEEISILDAVQVTTRSERARMIVDLIVAQAAETAKVQLPPTPAAMAPANQAAAPETAMAPADGSGAVCLNCGAALTGKQRKYCAPLCTNQHYYQQSGREKPKRYCVACGAELQGRRTKFCSDECKLAKAEDKWGDPTPVYRVERTGEELSEKQMADALKGRKYRIDDRVTKLTTNNRFVIQVGDGYRHRLASPAIGA